ncbi:MAG: hypothetical protein ABRQ39_06675 [Candidatus Eremiobacterota bacterium]
MKILSDRFSKIDKAGSLFSKNTVEQNILEVKDRVTLSHNTTTTPSGEVASIASTGFTESETPERLDTPASFRGQKELLEILNNMTDENNNVKFVASKGLLEALQCEGSFDKTAVLVKTGVNILSITAPADKNTLLEIHEPSLVERELKDEGMTDLLNFIHSIRDKKTPCVNTSISLKALEPFIKLLEGEIKDKDMTDLLTSISSMSGNNSVKYITYKGLLEVLNSDKTTDKTALLGKIGEHIMASDVPGYSNGNSSISLEAAKPLVEILKRHVEDKDLQKMLEMAEHISDNEPCSKYAAYMGIFKTIGSGENLSDKVRFWSKTGAHIMDSPVPGYSYGNSSISMKSVQPFIEELKHHINDGRTEELFELIGKIPDNEEAAKFAACRGLLGTMSSDLPDNKTALLSKTAFNIMESEIPGYQYGKTSISLKAVKPFIENLNGELKDEREKNLIGLADALPDSANNIKFTLYKGLTDTFSGDIPSSNVSLLGRAASNILNVTCPGYIDGNTSISLEAAEPVMKALKEELDDSESRALFNVTSLLKEENSPLKYCVYKGISSILSSGAGKDNIVNLAKAGNIAFNTTAKGYTDKKASYNIEAAELFMNAIETEGDKHITALCKAVRDGNYSGFNDRCKAYAKLLDSTILEEKRNRHHRAAALLAIGGTAGLAMAFATFSHSMPVIGSVLSALAGASFVEATIQHIKAMNI